MRKLQKLIRIGTDTYERLKEVAEGFATPDATINDILDQLEEPSIEKDGEEDEDDSEVEQ